MGNRPSSPSTIVSERRSIRRARVVAGAQAVGRFAFNLFLGNVAGAVGAGVSGTLAQRALAKRGATLSKLEEFRGRAMVLVFAAHRVCKSLQPPFFAAFGACSDDVRRWRLTTAASLLVGPGLVAVMAFSGLRALAGAPAAWEGFGPVALILAYQLFLTRLLEQRKFLLWPVYGLLFEAYRVSQLLRAEDCLLRERAALLMSHASVGKGASSSVAAVFQWMGSPAPSSGLAFVARLMAVAWAFHFALLLYTISKALLALTSETTSNAHGESEA